MIDAIRRCMLRDLDGMLAELDGYPDDASVWALPDGIANSTGTLALHLAGNLRHFVGGQLGGTGYVRDRDAEFADRGLSRDELRAAAPHRPRRGRHHPPYPRSGPPGRAVPDPASAR